MPHESGHEEGVQLDELSNEELGSLVGEFAEFSQFTAEDEQEFLGVPSTRVDPETGEGVPFFVNRPRRPIQDPDGSKFGFIRVPVTGRGEDIPDAFQPGDEWKILDLPLTVQAAMLNELEEVGFLDAYGLKRGLPEERIAAYGALLAFANQVGATNEQDALNRFRLMRDRGEIDLAEGLVGPRPPAPEDVRIRVRSALQSQLGRAPQEDIEAMMRAFDAQHAATRGGQGALPPSVEGFVEQQVRAGPDAAEAGAFEFNKRVRDFFGMLGGVGASPTPTQGPF